MESIIEYINDHLTIIIIIGSLLAIILYVIYATSLNKLNRLMYDKETSIAWIPIANIYLLGKLTIHKIFGFILAIGSLLGISVTITNNNIPKTYSILPENFQAVYYIIYCGIFVTLFVYALIKIKNIANERGNYTETYIPNTDHLNKPFIDNTTLVKKVIETNDNVENRQEDDNQFNYNEYPQDNTTINNSSLSLKDLNNMNKPNDLDNQNNENNIENPKN